MKSLNIVIGCDVDPDRNSFLPGQQTNRLDWRGMREGIPVGKKKTRAILDSDGKPPVFTWCIRVDHQVKQLCGSSDFVLKNYTKFLADLEGTGDEIAWHPHFWRYDEALKKWYQELADIDFQVTMLEEAGAAFEAAMPGRGKTVRMGWSYHNNRTFATLEKLGTQIECSSIPGLRILPKNQDVHWDGFYDWVGTPDDPYYPSREDFRRPARQGEQAVSVLEVPCFMTHSMAWGVFAGLVLSRKMKTFSPLTAALRRPAYIVNITGKPSLFSPLLSTLNKRLRRQETTTFLTYFHADELVENVHPVYKLEHMMTNLRSVLDCAKRNDVQVRFLRALDLKQVY